MLFQRTSFWLLQTWLVFIQVYRIKLVWRYLKRHWIKGKHIKYLPTSKLVKMAEYVLKNNYFQFSDKVLQQTSGTAIDTKFSPLYACTFMDQMEGKFLRTQKFQPLVWFKSSIIFSSSGLMVKTVSKTL